jgi:hypothetical protein
MYDAAVYITPSDVGDATEIHDPSDTRLYPLSEEHDKREFIDGNGVGDPLSISQGLRSKGGGGVRDGRRTVMAPS